MIAGLFASGSNVGIKGYFGAAVTAGGILVPEGAEAARRRRGRNRVKRPVFVLPKPEPVKIALRNVHTNDWIETSDLRNIAGEAFNIALRDHRMGEVPEMNIKLPIFIADIVQVLRQMGYKAEILEITSGFRTIETTEVLRNAGVDAALNSQHMLANALDGIFKDVPPHIVQQVAKNVARAHGHGGVGCYPTFTHFDVRPKALEIW